MCARLTPKYEEDVCGIKVESEQQLQLLGGVCKQPRIVLHTAEVNEKYLHPEQHGAESTHIKKEEEDFSNSSLTFVPLKSEDGNKGTSEEDGRAEPPSSSSSGHISREDVSEKYLHPEQRGPASAHIKEEEEDVTNLPLTFAPLKSDEDRGAEPPSSISSPHMTTEGDGNHSGPSQAPSDDIRSQSPDSGGDVDDEHAKVDRTCHTENKQWECTRCWKIFCSKWSLKTHTRTHAGEKPFACSVCGKTFSMKQNLSIHTRTHSGEKPFTCTDCGKSFSHMQNLTKHTRTHTGEKTFSCSDCGKSFSLLQNLRLHTFTHSGEKPFSCSICGQRFTQNSVLLNHTRTHTGEKPFACIFCGKRFSKKGSLTRHTRAHTGDKPFSCSNCDKSFTNKRSFIKHFVVHTGEKPFACSECGKSFSQKSSSIKHTKTHTCFTFPKRTNIDNFP